MGNKMRKEYEIKNCKREWAKVEANKQHCRYMCNNCICNNIYCMYNDTTITSRQRLNARKGI